MPRTIRKYANRRLYDTETSQYITLEDLKSLIVCGEDVQVRAAKSNQDITREVLLQLVAEQESLGQPILNETILLSLIRFYGNPMQGLASTYLEQTMATLQNQRQQLSEQIGVNFYTVNGSEMVSLYWTNPVQDRQTERTVAGAGMYFPPWPGSASHHICGSG